MFKQISRKLIFQIVIIVYLTSVFWWNMTRTLWPDVITQKVIVTRIDKGSYFNSWYNLEGPYNRKITVAGPDISFIYANSNQNHFKKIKQQDAIWVNIYCIGAPSWFDVFTFGRKFNYVLINIPKTNPIEKDKDSIIWTTNTITAIVAVCSILIGLMFKNRKKIKSPD